jgi:adrenodoxin-NADP+ reductase
MGTGAFEDIEAQLVLKSIGYKSLPLAGAPFDARAGVVPNVAGRVLRQPSQQQQQQPGSSSSDSGSEFEPGLYVCGWVKRGPTGLIGTNSSDADETVNSIIADAPPGASATASSPAAGLAGLAALLASRGVPSVDFDGWRAIDAAEVAAGREVGKPREKLVRVDDMLKAAAVAAEEAGS